MKQKMYELTVTVAVCYETSDGEFKMSPDEARQTVLDTLEQGLEELGGFTVVKEDQYELDLD